MEEDEAAHTLASTQPEHMHKGKEGYQCKVCGKSFIRAWDLVQHLWMHTGDRPFGCDQCSCSFNSLANLQKHQRMKHSVQSAKCEEEELIPDVNERSFKCHKCGNNYKTRKRLLKHQRHKHSLVKREEEAIDVTLREAPQKLISNVNEKPFECNQCGSSYKAKKDLRRHQRMKHQEVKFEEEEIAVTVKEAPQNLLSNTEEAPFQSDQCRDSFTTNSSVQRHKHLTYEGIGPFKCDHCGDEFSTIAKANAHKRTRHADTYCTLFMCAQCGCKFTTRKQLTIHQVQSLHIGKESAAKVHERTRDTAQDYNSDDQSVNADNKSDKKRRKHTEKKSLKCNYCGKVYHNNSSLIIHERRHTGERPFSCDYCDWATTSMSNLRAHQNCRHLGKRLAPLKQAHALQSPTKDFILEGPTNKRFKCDYCGKGFKSRSHLQEHKYIHTGRPYNCEACGRGFVREIQLLRHKFLCGVSMFRCYHCSVKFSSRIELLRHQQLHNSKAEAPHEDGDKSTDKLDKYSCSPCEGSFLDQSSLAVHKCDDQSTEKTLTCKDCGTMVRVGGTTLSNVFTVIDHSNVKCFINNHTLF